MTAVQQMQQTSSGQQQFSTGGKPTSSPTSQAPYNTHTFSVSQHFRIISTQ